MTAQEMFEKRNWKFIEDEDDEDDEMIEYCQDILESCLLFFKEEKICQFKLYNGDSMDIDISIIQAIYQQAKELGWLDECQ